MFAPFQQQIKDKKNVNDKTRLLPTKLFNVMIKTKERKLTNINLQNKRRVSQT